MTLFHAARMSILLTATALCCVGCEEPEPGDAAWLLGLWEVTPTQTVQGTLQLRFGAGGKGLSTLTVNGESGGARPLIWAIERHAPQELTDDNVDAKPTWTLVIRRYQKDGGQGPPSIGQMSDLDRDSFTTVDDKGATVHYRRFNIKTDT